MATETWVEIEQPILEAIRAAELSGAEDVAHAARAAVPDMRGDLYVRTLFALYDDGYIEALADHGAALILPSGLAPRGRRAVRQWPTGAMADLFLDEIEKRLSAAPNEEAKSRLRRFAGSAGEVGKDFLADVLAAVAVRSAGLG